MNQLIIKPYLFEKTAFQNVSSSEEDWTHDVSKYMAERLPYLYKYKTRVTFEKTDGSSGYAYGSIKVGDSMYLPFCIKQFELLPIDVFNYKGKFYPLSEKRVEELLFDASMFSQVMDRQQTDSSTYPASYPPHSGKYTYASAHFLRALSGHVTAEDQREFHAKLYDEQLLAGFKKNGTLGLLKEAADLGQFQKTASFKKGLAPSLRPNVVQIVKEADGKFVVRTTSDRYFEPFEQELTYDQVITKLSEKAKKKLIREGEYGTVYGYRPWKPVILEAQQSDVESVGSTGTYRVQDTNYALREGWVFNSLKKFDGSSLSGKLFTDGAAYALQDKLVGEKIDKEMPGPCEQGRKALRSQKEPFAVGNTGVFYNGDSATEPLTITSMVMDGGDNIRFEARNQFGDNFIIEVTSAVKEIKKSPESERVYYYPITWKWAPIGNKVIKLLDDVKDRNFVKAATETQTAGGRVTKVISEVDGTFTILDRDGKHCKNASMSTAKFYLMALGCEPDTAEEALFYARQNGRVSVAGTKQLVTLSEKVANVIEDVKRDIDRVKAMRVDLLKAASAIDDEETVDKILGLNFLTPENIKIFVQFLPAFEDASSKLAQMLLAIRIGMKEVPEAAVKMAMENLTQVIDSLKALEMSQTPKPSYI